MDSFIKNELEKYQNNLQENLEYEFVSDFNDRYDDGFFISKIMNSETGIYRAPLSGSIGEIKLLFKQQFSLEECLRGTFKIFNESLKILDRELYLQSKKFLKERPEELVLPRKDHHHLINSKVQYLKVLQEKGFISPDSQILFPIDGDGEWIDFTNKKHFDELKKYIDELKKINCKNYPVKTGKNKKEAFKNNRCVLKLPYAGSSDCVLYPNNVTYGQERGNFLFWLAVFLVNKDQHENPYMFDCVGFTQGIIIDRFNPYISQVGEFRTFISNGDPIGMSYSSEGTVDGLASIKPLLLKSSIKNEDDTEGFFIYEKTLEIFKKSITKSASLRKFWDNSLSDTDNFLKLVMEKIAIMAKQINELFNLDLNRFDFTVNHNTLGGDSFNIMINELEDIVFGEASYNQFCFIERIDMKYEQYKYLKKVYPEKYESLINVQDKLVIQNFTDTDPFEAMNVESLIESYQNALSSDNLTSNRRKLRSSKRSKSKSRSSRSSSENAF